MRTILAISAISLPLLISSTVSAQTTSAPGDSMPAPVTQNLKPAEGIPGDHLPTQHLNGWSLKAKLGQAVYNETHQKIGEIKDIIMSDSGTPTYFIIGAGGLLGMGEHQVAIPYDKITGTRKLVLQGYTLEQLKDLPPVEVSK